eukprot:COSAG02_NODE_822_length_16778_cov_4.476168_11_plen_151_part_00
MCAAAATDRDECTRTALVVEHILALPSRAYTSTCPPASSASIRWRSSASKNDDMVISPTSCTTIIRLPYCLAQRSSSCTKNRSRQVAYPRAGAAGLAASRGCGLFFLPADPAGAAGPAGAAALARSKTRHDAFCHQTGHEFSCGFSIRLC